MWSFTFTATWHACRQSGGLGSAVKASDAEPFAMRTPGTCSRTIEPIPNRCQHDTLMFDPVQAPPLRHAFELANAAILEADSRLQHQILDRARDQDLAGTRFRGDARADVKCETDHVRPAHFVFAGVQPHPDLQPQRGHGLADCGRAMDPGRRRVERREQSVPVVTASFPRNVFSSLRTRRKW
jgi:hypothetical protein